MLSKANETRFLKSTLVYVRVFVCIYVYVTGFEYTFLNSFLKSTSEAVHIFM